jgi:hypothetical protein
MFGGFSSLAVRKEGRSLYHLRLLHHTDLGDALRMPIVISIPAEAVRRLVVRPAPRRRPSNGPPTKSILTGL